jgi:hypothetical protein
LLSSIFRLAPSTLVGLIDFAPMFGLSPLFTCYCISLVAALQQKRVLSGVKQLKAFCTIFMQTSEWHRALCRRGPWNYEWDPPMRTLVRELSACFLLFTCLKNPDLLPVDSALISAHTRAGTLSDRADWKKFQQDLALKHAHLDAALTATNIAALADVLASMSTVAAGSLA